MMFNRLLSATLSISFHFIFFHFKFHPPISPVSYTIRCNLGPTPRSHFFEGELIYWVARAK